MFLRILKRDLKRKKTANIIVLLFIITATVFVSGSMNSILAIGKGVDYFFEKSEMSDYFIATSDVGNMESDLENIKKIEGVKNAKVFQFILLDASEVYRKGEKRDDAFGTMVIGAADKTGNILFDRSGEPITEIERGTVYLNEKDFNSKGFNMGDEIVIKFDSGERTFRVAGATKDAVMGASSVSLHRILLNSEEFTEIYGITENHGLMFCIDTDDVKKVEQFDGMSGNHILTVDKTMLMTVFFGDMMVSALFVVVSICLILISCMVLKFIISSTLAEEFREIGVMKAIGIRNRKIRLLYIIKYFVLALTGAVVGFFGGIPFGNLLVDNASKTMLLEKDGNIVLGILSALAVVVTVVSICYFYTGKIKRLSPVNAVSNIDQGKKQNKKRWLRIKNHPGKASSFLALNDITGNLKKYITMIVAYSICLLLVMILTNLFSTVTGKHFITFFGTKEFDITSSFDEETRKNLNLTDSEDVEENIVAFNNYVDSKMKENGFSSKSYSEVSFYSKVTHGDLTVSSTSFLGIGSSAEEYEYLEGVAPKLKNELALSEVIADKINAKIGDKVSIQSTVIEGEFTVTAIFQTMSNLGEGIRFSENVDRQLNKFTIYAPTVMTVFDDHPDNAEVERRIQIMKEKMPVKTMETSTQLVNDYSDIIEILQNVKTIVMILAAMVVALITVLLERSFSIAERSETALLKAIGFKSKSIYLQHTLRFIFAGLISTVIAMLLMFPVTTISMNPIFAYMGAKSGIVYEYDFLALFVLNPLFILGITALTAFVTSLFTKSVKAYHTASIE